MPPCQYQPLKLNNNKKLCCFVQQAAKGKQTAHQYRSLNQELFQGHFKGL